MFISRFALALLCAVPVVILAGNPPAIKITPAPQTSPASGPEMFKAYCASCHGADARGKGPAAPAMKVTPTDLTLLAKNNGGKFPDRHVFAAIRGDVNFAAHGSAGMPVWGTIFREMADNAGDDREPAMRMATLCRYIASLQQK